MENKWLVSLLVVVEVVLISMAEQVTSQPTDMNSTLMRYQCSVYKSSLPEYYLSNLNTTLSRLRQKLTTGRYATAHCLINNEPVWGVAWCRGYLSVPDCLDCFDFAVDQLKLCGLSYWGRAIYTDCDVRYDNFFTEDYDIIPEDYHITSDMQYVVLCDNTTLSGRIEFQREVEFLLLDLQNAAPRTSNFYAASITNVDVCFMRYATTPFFGRNQTTDVTSILMGTSTKERYIIRVVIGGVCSLLLALAFFVWCGEWKKICGGQQDKHNMTFEAPAELKGTINYNYQYLELATNNFSGENIIGKGGFGEVFKAVIDDKKVVAVKKLKVGYAGAKVGFENEILLISHIRHRNLLGLLGWSSEGSNLLLVLEYMPNGSLDRFLWGERRGFLNWKRRYDIILGIARGLAHLHKEFHVRIVHRDIKSSNILLDENFKPKIADFGLAKFQPEDQSHVITKFAGTLGYTAPEYVMYGVLSDKVDTFSFGIVILEIISGRKCTYRSFDGTSTDCLLEHAWKLYETHKLMKLVDETLDANLDEETHVMKIIEIALLCTQSPVSERPAMSEVVLMLQNDPSLGERKLTKPNFTDQNRRIH
ncbi:putative protein kinase RLK-Pelle-DLSV family [Helianthus debilis subsp. tardiflorus]